MRRFHIAFVLAATALVAWPGTAAWAVDPEAARAFVKKHDCLKCHAVNKSKKGPSYKKIAEKYKGKADAEEKIIKSLTTGPRVKLEDGSEEDHKIVEFTNEAERTNIVAWLLSL